MSFGGHVLDMINRLAQNKAMLNGRRERLRELRDMYYEVNKPADNPTRYQYKKLSEKERQELKLEILQLEKRDRFVRMFAIVVALVITIGIFYVLFIR
ncbi:MAG: hypothetical protein V2I62_05550 [Bacteroidales bacterium]|jgi:hypothetical protein|nr:hypothetical protein [Bacteroidales bacterium]